MNRPGVGMALFAVIYFAGCSFESKVEWYDHVRESKYVLIDQVGPPYLDLFFLSASQMNQAKTMNREDILQTFRPPAVNRVESIRSALDSVAAFPGQAAQRKPVVDVVNAYLSGYLTIDFALPIGYANRNGRALTDDAFDVLFEATSGRTGVSDEVPTLKERLEERNKDLPDLKKQTPVGISFDSGFPFLRRRSS